MISMPLRKQVAAANKTLAQSGLIVLTWGNASAIDRRKKLIAIKPSGIEYSLLRPEDIVLLSSEDGSVVEGELNPSSDTPTHLHLYQQFPAVGAVIHTHSAYATAWAQACREIPCFGTTHADHFYGPVPLTRHLTSSEAENEYELNTGKVIVERFENGNLNPEEVPGVLVAGHGPFAWGPNLQTALNNAIAFEEIAKMAWLTLEINPKATPLPPHLFEKHYSRKHGKSAYYGQAKKSKTD